MLVSPCDLYNNVLVSFFSYVGAKDEKLFFLLFFIDLNAMLKMSLVYLDYFSILKQAEPGCMEKCAQKKVYKRNGHLSTLLLISSFATFPNSFPE